MNSSAQSIGFANTYSTSHVDTLQIGNGKPRGFVDGNEVKGFVPDGSKKRKKVKSRGPKWFKTEVAQKPINPLIDCGESLGIVDVLGDNKHRAKAYVPTTYTQGVIKVDLMSGNEQLASFVYARDFDNLEKSKFIKLRDTKHEVSEYVQKLRESLNEDHLSKQIFNVIDESIRNDAKIVSGPKISPCSLRRNLEFFKRLR